MSVKKNEKTKEEKQATEKTIETEIPKRAKNKVCIIGCADTNKKAPWDKKDIFEFWGVNNLYNSMKDKKFDRWFDIHSIVHDGLRFLRRGIDDFRGITVDKYIKDLAELDIPIYLQKAIPQIPKSIEFPLQKLLSIFGDYFTNTISYEIALAIFEKFEEIHIYGVDMAVDTEYYWQRPSCEYFIGAARGLGIKVYLPDECDLLKTRFLYGFQDIQENKWIKKTNNTIQAMEKRRQEAIQKMTIFSKQVEQYNGGIQAIHELNKIWKNL